MPQRCLFLIESWSWLGSYDHIDAGRDDGDRANADGDRKPQAKRIELLVPNDRHKKDANGHSPRQHTCLRLGSGRRLSRTVGSVAAMDGGNVTLVVENASCEASVHYLEIQGNL